MYDNLNWDELLKLSEEQDKVLDRRAREEQTWLIITIVTIVLFGIIGCLALIVES